MTSSWLDDSRGFTYNPRSGLRLEDQLKEYLDDRGPDSSGLNARTAQAMRFAVAVIVLRIPAGVPALSAEPTSSPCPATFRPGHRQLRMRETVDRDPVSTGRQ